MGFFSLIDYEREKCKELMKKKETHNFSQVFGLIKGKKETRKIRPAFVFLHFLITFLRKMFYERIFY